MPRPSVLSDETKRLDALHRYDILDTPPEEGFDRVTRLAARWLDVPITLIVLLDEDRQWFKSSVGVDLCETDREISFCAHNVHDTSLLVVPDATADARFSDNPLVTGPPGIRFYAGAPLVTPDGHVLGSLCVIDTEPRRPGSMDLDVLRDLAEMVMTELEFRSTNADLRERNQQVQALSRELKIVQENDRSQLSRLLHEELQQILQAARMTLENARDPDVPAEETGRRLVRAAAGLDDALDVTRALSARFAPPVGNQPLRDTLEWLAQKMRTGHGLSVSVLGSGAVSGTNEALKTLLYHLVRELLFRVVRRVDTSTAQVHLIESTGHLRLTVEEGDDAGDPIGNLQNEGSPLARLHTQLESLGGSIQVRASAGAGTCITIKVPQGAMHSSRRESGQVGFGGEIGAVS